ncbi:IclR family transcriptional regulator [Dictyobacter alpinus]|uniref:Glycerol operon regulatory protein n=1 Tax=Dictyobacter alpinus TaxID=2014873 RepID=A0A402BDP3_9CHLR|nr:IclR family transcriptional regulator [Dictyobacter alpinus]GCE29551.1 IclR family transcriptional regulator [Dictyobacter alpinus]
MEETQARGHIKSVDKAIDILQVLAPESAGMQLNEIARSLQINSSTAHHLLDTLKQRGFVDQHEQTGAYKLGYQFIGLAMMFLSQTDLFSASSDIVRELRDLSGETTYLNVLNNRQIVPLIELTGTRPVQARRSPSGGSELYATSSGKLQLAYLPARQFADILASEPLKQFTPNTIADRDALQKEMEIIRQQGYALDREEHIPGVLCIDAPVFNHQKECIATVSVSYPATSLTERNEELRHLVIQAARQISQKLGYRTHSIDTHTRASTHP